MLLYDDGMILVMFYKSKQILRAGDSDTMILIVPTSLTQNLLLFAYPQPNNYDFQWEGSSKRFHQPAAGILSMCPKAKFCNKMRGRKHDKVHNVRQRLQSKGGKAAPASTDTSRQISKFTNSIKLNMHLHGLHFQCVNMNCTQC